MRHRRYREPHTRGDSVVLGLGLVAVGTLLLLSKLGYIYSDILWTWWALFPLAYGMWRVVQWRSAHRVASGVSMICFAIWFLSSSQGWFGLDWGTSWPFVFVGIGANILVRELLEPVFARRNPPVNPVNGGTGHA